LPPKSVRVMNAPSGKSASPDPAPAARVVTVAGMFTATQCHQPGRWAHRGRIVMAKLRVPSGAPLQASGGEILPPR
jgi:hypothetical protein